MAPRGRPQQRFTHEPDTAGERRKMGRALASAEASAAKIESIEHMLSLARKEMVRVMDHASSVGVTHAQLGRVYGLTTSRIGQMIREYNAGKPAEREGTESE